MNFALGYLFHRFFFRITDFFHHWYMDGSRIFFHRLVLVLEKFDRIFAVGISIRFFFRPLFGDYSLIGRFLGIIFRTIRIVLGIVVYSAILFIFLGIYFVWLSVPLIILYLIFDGLTEYAK